MKRIDTKLALSAALTLSLSLAGSACMTPGLYHSARVLDKGHTELAVAFHPSVSHISSYDDNGQRIPADTPMGDPGSNPDIAARIGVSDNMDVGLRVQPLSAFGEIDTKLRLVGDDDSQFHLAVQPGLGLSVPLVSLSAQATLPLIATYEFTDMVSATGYGYGQYAHHMSLFGGSDGFNAESLAMGLGGGVELHGDLMFLMPYVNVSTQTMFSQGFASPLAQNNNLMAGLMLGFHGDLFHRIEDKIDGVDQKLDDNNDDMNEGFDKIDRRFDSLDEHLKGIDDRLDRVEQKGATGAAQTDEQPDAQRDAAGTAQTE